MSQIKEICYDCRGRRLVHLCILKFILLEDSPKGCSLHSGFWGRNASMSTKIRVSSSTSQQVRTEQRSPAPRPARTTTPDRPARITAPVRTTEPARLSTSKPPAGGFVENRPPVAPPKAPQAPLAPRTPSTTGTRLDVSV